MFRSRRKSSLPHTRSCTGAVQTRMGSDYWINTLQLHTTKRLRVSYSTSHSLMLVTKMIKISFIKLQSILEKHNEALDHRNRRHRVEERNDRGETGRSMCFQQDCDGQWHFSHKAIWVLPNHTTEKQDKQLTEWNLLPYTDSFKYEKSS